MKRRSIFISLTCLGAITSVIALAALTGVFENRNNGFVRIFPFKKLKPFATYHIPSSVTSFIGRRDTMLYLKTRVSNQLFSIDTRFRNAKMTLINLEDVPSNAQNLKHEIRNGLLFTYAGNNNYIFITDLAQKHLIKKARLNFHLTRGVSLSSGSFVFRAFNAQLHDRDQCFIKLNDSVLHKAQVTPVYDDAGFTTDGNLFYSSRDGIIVYSYFYSNEIICLDTNLNMLYSFKTIDTISHFRASTSVIRQPNGVSKTTNSAPLRVVNMPQQLVGNTLYINSMLKADNESKKAFSESMVIDKYDIKTKNYLGSFYIPKHRGERPQDMYTTETVLYAKYPSSIIAYSMH